MPLFTKKIAKKISQSPFAKNEIVMNLVKLPGVPIGTKGKIKVSNGISWQRYWTFFENGIDIGQIDASLLARPQDFEMLLEQIGGLEEERASQKEELKKQQEVLLDQFLNPPPQPEPQPEPEAIEANEEPTTAIDSAEAPTQSEAPPLAKEEAPPAVKSSGKALVDVPSNLLQRAAEARARLS